MPLETRADGPHSEENLPPVWVMPAALELLADDGDTELVEELIADFQTDTAGRLESIARALRSADYPAIRLEVHTIRGGAMQVGAERVAARCSRMEVAAQQPQPEILNSLFGSVLVSFAEVRAVLAARRGAPVFETPRADRSTLNGE